MAYVGTPIDSRTTFQSLAGKRFNGDGSTTAFTLDVAPSSTLDIEVFVGNVRQDPNSAYSLSGVTLTFSAAPASGTNNIYVVHQAKSVGTIDPPATETVAKTFSAGITMSGATPTLTIGDAGAEDAKIVFDGNAQDFHIGLDDSVDDLVIGVGSALGTTTAISITEGKAVTIGETGIASSIAGIPLYRGDNGGLPDSIYTHDVSGTDSGAQYNSAYGMNSLDAITTGDNNACFGQGSGGKITTGASNTFFGTGAGSNFDAESHNVGVGNDALAGPINGGEYNIAIGTNAANAITSGDYNIAIGSESGGVITTGVKNVLVGTDAGKLIVGGEENTCFGDKAGDAITSGDKNVCIGPNVDVATNTGDNAIVIGHAITGAVNDFSFGKASNVVSNDFDSDADWSRSSDVRLKTNIKSTTLGLDFINDLRPVKFNWKPSYEIPKEMKSEYNIENQKNLDYVSHGFIAQEVKEAIDKHGDTTFGGWHLDKTDNETQRVKKNMFIMPLIKAVQELSEEVKELKEKLEAK